MVTAIDRRQRIELIEAWGGGVEIVRILTLGFFVALMWLAISHDDIALPGARLADEGSSIYVARLMGLKVLDLLTLIAAAGTSLYLLLRRRMVVTDYHRSVGLMLAVYAVAGLIGVVYAYVYDYPLERWYQDAQQTLYFALYFLIVFHLTESKKSWQLLFLLFLLFLGLKNIIILERLFSGVGKVLGVFGVRTTQSSDAAVFPALFAIGIPLLLHPRVSPWLKAFLAASLTVYVFNALISFGRTVWVILLFLTVYYLFTLDRRSRRSFVVVLSATSLVALALVLTLFPRFFALASWKFRTIFDWSVQGDRSNATRTLEVLNIFSRLFEQGALFHGMGLGAWWDDRYYTLLPDGGSGFAGKSRYYMAHLWVVEQMLKVGLMGLVVYWYAVVRIVRTAYRHQQALPANSPQRALMLGLSAAFLAIMLTNTDLVKVYLLLGIVLGLLARCAVFLDAGTPPVSILLRRSDSHVQLSRSAE